MKNYHGRFMREAELRELGVAEVGDCVAVHETCVMIGMENIRFGSNIRVDPFAVLSVARGWLKLGDFVHIGTQSFISAGSGVEFCDFSSLSPGVRIFSRSDDYLGEYMSNPTVPSQFTLPAAKNPVRIGRHVVVGSGTTVLPEVDIGDGSSVGAGAVVTRSCEPGGVYAGAPAKLVKPRRTDIFDLERQLRAALEAGQLTPPVSRL